MKKMRLTFNVEEDNDLREYVRNIIKGQIVSLIREETKKLLQEVIEDKKEEIINKYSRVNIESAVRDYIEKVVDKQFKINHGSCYTPLSSYSFEKIAREIIDERVSNKLFINEKIVEDAITDMVKKIIKERFKI